jgi:hypothetical protein
MPESRPSRKASILDMLTSFSPDNPSSDSVWRQALLLKELAKDDRAASRERRAEAVAARAQAEHDAITATKQVCAELQAQARVKLQQAEDALGHAQRLKNESEAKAVRMIEDSKSRLEHAEAVKREADSYAEEIRSSARAAADALLAQARAGSQEIANRMRQETAEEVRRVLADVEVARSAAADELETQRILSDTARIRAFSQRVGRRKPSEEEDEDETHEVVEFKPATAEAPVPAETPQQAKARQKRELRWGHSAAKVRRARKIRKVA